MHLIKCKVKIYRSIVSTCFSFFFIEVRDTNIMNIETYTSINQVVLKFVGLYPINIVRYITCIGAIILIVIPLIAQIYNNLEDLNIILETRFERV